MRLHLVGLPHTETTDEWVTCAYTMKVHKFGEMMRAQGFDCVLYAGEHNTAPGYSEHVPLVSRAERDAWYGPFDQNGTWGEVTWNPTDEPWLTMNTRAIEEIRKRAGPRDIILATSGWPQKQIGNALPQLIFAEPFVGYEGLTANFAAFESVSWRHHVYGLRQIKDGRWYDTVVPNFFRPDDFHLEPKDEPPYLLYIGRLISRKGILTAHQVARAAGMRLKVAGPGAKSYKHLKLVATDGCTLDRVDYLGPLGLEERAEAMARATAVLAPTAYIEPFGGVAVEAMLSGTPVIADVLGAFTETIQQGVTGFRFNTLAEGVDAVQRCHELDPATIRRYAIHDYSLAAVGPQFADWFRRLEGLYDEGWTTMPAKAV